MKTFQIIFACLFLFAGITNAQTAAKKSSLKTSTFKVWGNCGMCKTTIEGAAKTNGASYANWDMSSKMLTVKYAAAKTNDDKIQKGIANAGYDNVKYTAEDDAYEGLHECCKYERKSDAVNTKGEKGMKEACCVKDGKCTGNMECCKKMDGKGDCCKDGKCAEKGGCCADMKCSKGGDCCKKDGVAKMDCCKGEEGKCSHK
jgi:periplasmic mercuric ion binding protein